MASRVINITAVGWRAPSPSQVGRGYIRGHKTLNTGGGVSTPLFEQGNNPPPFSFPLYRSTLLTILRYPPLLFRNRKRILSPSTRPTPRFLLLLLSIPLNSLNSSRIEFKGARITIALPWTTRSCRPRLVQ